MKLLDCSKELNSLSAWLRSIDFSIAKAETDLKSLRTAVDDGHSVWDRLEWVLSECERIADGLCEV